MTENLESRRSGAERELERLLEDCIYSSKGHYNAADWWSKAHYWIGIPTAVLAAIGSTTAFAELAVIAGVIGMLVAATAAVSTFLDPNAKSTAHRVAANEFLTLRNSARRFWELDASALDDNGVIDQVKAFASKRDELNASSPQIPRRSYEKARRGIEEGEASHKVDSERKAGE